MQRYGYIGTAWSPAPCHKRHMCYGSLKKIEKEDKAAISVFFVLITATDGLGLLTAVKSVGGRSQSFPNRYNLINEAYNLEENEEKGGWDGEVKFEGLFWDLF